MILCKSCLYPTTKPDLHFVDGECAACRSYKARSTIDWEGRRKDFNDIISSVRRNSSGFDCIVPSSGGKDSTYQVVTLIEMGLRPLVVTATTCHLTDTGKYNIDNLAKIATTVEYTPNRTVRAKLNRLGLQLVGDISLPEHMAIFSIPFRAAVDFDIPLVVYGECPTMEYGGPPGSEAHKVMTRRYIMEHQGFMGMRPSDFIGMDGITEFDMRDYMLPSNDKLNGVTALFMGQYIPWDSRRNAHVAYKAGFRTWGKPPCRNNWWEFENLDNAQTGLHDYFGYLKYGYTRGAAQLSVDIRSGIVSRDEAIKEIGIQSPSNQFPYEYMGVNWVTVLRHVGMSTVEFEDTVDKFKNKELFNGAN